MAVMLKAKVAASIEASSRRGQEMPGRVADVGGGAVFLREERDDQRERANRRFLRQIRQPGAFRPGIDVEARQRREDAERRAAFLGPHRGEEKAVELGVKKRELC